MKIIKKVLEMKAFKNILWVMFGIILLPSAIAVNALIVILVLQHWLSNVTNYTQIVTCSFLALLVALSSFAVIRFITINWERKESQA